MNEGKPQRAMVDSGNRDGSQRRRSARLSSPPQAEARAVNKMALASVAVKRSIAVRKIAPRKTVAPSEHDKENTPRQAGSEGGQRGKVKVSTPGPVPGRRDSSSAKKNKAAMPSPILPSSPPPLTRPQPAADPQDAMWSQKVRRSYSRLSDKSLNSPDSRETLFGFGELKTPDVFRRVGQSKTGLELPGSLSGVNSFTSLLAGDECAPTSPEPDLNIPGVAVAKEGRRRRRRKVQHIDATELDAMAAEMNAEFAQAEVFELVVE